MLKMKTCLIALNLAIHSSLQYMYMPICSIYALSTCMSMFRLYVHMITLLRKKWLIFKQLHVYLTLKPVKHPVLPAAECISLIITIYHPIFIGMPFNWGRGILVCMDIGHACPCNGSIYWWIIDVELNLGIVMYIHCAYIVCIHSPTVSIAVTNHAAAFRDSH